MFHGAISKAQGCCQRKLQKCVCACEGEGRCGDRTHVFWALLTNPLPSITASLPTPQPLKLWQLGHPREAGLGVPKGS